MPFAVFRRHQRKLLAIFAILAMFGFVVADSLPRLLSGGPVAGGNTTVVDLYGRSVRRSDINEMASERNNANLFMAETIGLLYRRPSANFFGDLSTKSLVDALILRHEADRLGMPVGPEIAREWLKQRFGPAMNKELFDIVLSRFNNRLTGEELLREISNQIRLANVRLLIGAPVVTPLDVFETYRDQNERVAARAVGFKVEDYLVGVPEPSAAQVESYYSKYKDQLPDPARPTPGFKVPRQVEVEILSIDGEALARSIKDKLTEQELLTYYENRKNEFKKPSEFPDDIFQGSPELTPPLVQPFSDLRINLAISLAEEKAQAEIVNKFGKIKDEVMFPFAESYVLAEDEIAEAKKLGRKTNVTMPKPQGLKDVAAKEGLEYVVSPLMSRDEATKYSYIAGAEVGLNRLSGGRKFVEEIYDTRSALYEPIEFTDFTGRRFLVRKLQDLSPRVPSLDEVRSKVVLAWKTEQARPAAYKAAEALAKKLKAEGGKITTEIVDGHTVINTDAISKLQPGMPIPGQFFETGPPTPSEVAQIPFAGPTLRDTYFGLREGSVEVAPDEPESAYYVLTLKTRVPASFGVLYAPSGEYIRYKSEALTEAYKKRDEQWMNELRVQAGLKPDWTPSEDAKSAADKETNG